VSLASLSQAGKPFRIKYFVRFLQLDKFLSREALVKVNEIVSDG
jgi:hypothetical protein